MDDVKLKRSDLTDLSVMKTILSANFTPKKTALYILELIVVYKTNVNLK